jgi:hypothetical protein
VSELDDVVTALTWLRNLLKESDPVLTATFGVELCVEVDAEVALSWLPGARPLNHEAMAAVPW